MQGQPVTYKSYLPDKLLFNRLRSFGLFSRLSLIEQRRWEKVAAVSVYFSMRVSLSGSKLKQIKAVDSGSQFLAVRDSIKFFRLTGILPLQ